MRPRALGLSLPLMALSVQLQALSAATLQDIRAEPTGTGVIRGVVQTDDADHHPLVRATLNLSGGGLLTTRMGFTDTEGRFEFNGLPAGAYTLEAGSSSYIRQTYGAKRPGGAGSTIALAEGQRADDIVFRLARYASISGIIYDQNGEPARGISVEAMQYTMRTGRRTLSSVYGQPAFTDDRGAYSIGLLPGTYYIAAGPSPDRGPTDVQRLTATDIDRALQSLTGTAVLTTPITFSQPHQGFAPVFFPGSPDFSRAQPIMLGDGEDRTGINVQLQLVPTARIDGTVSMPGGQPPSNTQVVATAVTEAFSLDLFNTGTLGTTGLDVQGRFSYQAIPPGRYAITARSPARPAGPAGDALPPMWAIADILVAGSDQTINLSLQPGMSVSGKVVFKGTTLQPPANIAGIRMSMPAAITGLGVTFVVNAVNINADGTFMLSGAAPGNYKLSATTPAAPAGWGLRSVMMDGVDVLDIPFTVRPGQNIENVVVTFVDQLTEISGTLHAPTGAPTADYFIIVFSTDKTYWGPLSRRSVMARPSNAGRYTIRNLPPGEYHVAAVTDVQQNEWFDPAFLEKLLTSGTIRVALEESDKKTLDLRLSGESR
jgi:hypothetical protein